MNYKAIIGRFAEECKSTNIYEFATWLECKEEYQKEIEKAHRAMQPIKRERK